MLNRKSLSQVPNWIVLWVDSSIVQMDSSIGARLNVHNFQLAWTIATDIEVMRVTMTIHLEDSREGNTIKSISCLG